MLLFAELSAEGWVMILGALFLGLTQILAMVLSYLRDRNNQQMAAQREANRIARETNLAGAVGKIAAQTDGITKQLVAQAEKSGIRQGEDRERARTVEVVKPIIEAAASKAAETAIQTVADKLPPPPP